MEFSTIPLYRAYRSTTYMYSESLSVRFGPIGDSGLHSSLNLLCYHGSEQRYRFDFDNFTGKVSSLPESYNYHRRMLRVYPIPTGSMIPRRKYRSTCVSWQLPVYYRPGTCRGFSNQILVSWFLSSISSHWSTPQLFIACPSNTYRQAHSHR